MPEASTNPLFKAILYSIYVIISTCYHIHHITWSIYSTLASYFTRNRDLILNDITKHPQHIAFVFGDEMEKGDVEKLIQKVGDIVCWSIKHQIHSLSFYDPEGKYAR
jgi:hypothetical protein